MDKSKIRILITAGPTREPIDEVRFLSNISTGKLGVEIAKEARARGYQVELLLGEGSIVEIPPEILVTRFSSAQDLLNKSLERIKNVDVYVASAAVADYAPKKENIKISSYLDQLNLILYPTPKVIKEVKKVAREETIFVSFKLGYGSSEEELHQLAQRNYGEIANIIVLNDLTQIKDNQHLALIQWKGEDFSRAYSKRGIAVGILDCLEQRELNRKRSE